MDYPLKPKEYTQRQLFPPDGLTLTGEYLLNHDLEAHSHDFVEIALMTMGSGRHVTRHGSEPLSPGDLIVVRPGAWHAYQECFGLGVYNCCFRVDLLHHELAWTRRDAALNHLLWRGPLAFGRQGIFKISLDAAGFQAGYAWLQRLHAEATANHAELIAFLLLFLSAAARYAPLETLGNGQISGHSAVLEVMRQVECNLAFAWRLQALSDHVHLHPS